MTDTGKIKQGRKPATCPYCHGNHTIQNCRHPDIVEFSQYLESMFLDLYKLATGYEDKKNAAYNLLGPYSAELIRVAGRNTSAQCFNGMTTETKYNVLTSKRFLTDVLTDCMFVHFRYKYPGVVEGKPDKSFLNRFKAAFTFTQKDNEPSAPPIDLMDDKVFSDIKGPSAPPLEDDNTEGDNTEGDNTEGDNTNVGGKRRKSIKYRKHNRRRTRKYYSKRR